MKKTLPIAKPLITAYPYHANLLSVLQAHDSARTFPWILDHYLQLAMPDSPHDVKMDFYIFSPWKNCPFIYYQRIERPLITQNWQSFSDFAINCIDNGNYIYALVDHFYLPPADEYQSRHWVHDMFIHAYDLEERTFHISDYFKGGVYESVVVSFDAVNDAYNNVMADMDWLYGVELIRYRADRLYWFNPTAIQSKLLKYLRGYNFALLNQNAGEYWKSGFMFGTMIYDKLVTHYKLLRDQQTDIMDIRPFHVLYEHKKILHHLTDYLNDNGFIQSRDLSEAAVRLEEEAYVLRNMYLKMQLSGNDRLIDRLIAATQKIRITEEEMLTGLIDNLEESFNTAGNLLSHAVITSSSDNLIVYRNVSNIADPDINLLYRSDENPLFPVVLHFSWDHAQSMKCIKMKSRFGQTRGITDFDIEVMLEDKWSKVLEVRDYKYEYDDYTVETLNEHVGPIESFKEMKLTIRKANMTTNCFEINWVGLFNC